MRKLFSRAAIRTMDPDQPVADIVEVRDGRISRVCRAEGLDTCPDTEEEVVDLGGKAVLPGFIDSHMHFSQMAWELSLIDLSGVGNAGELRQVLVKNRRREETGSWLIGRRLRGLVLDEVIHQTRAIFDTVTGKEPAILGSEDMHSALINARGADLLEKEGVIDPSEAGFVERSGEVTLLREKATHATWRWIEKREKVLSEESLAECARYLNSLGITGNYSFERLRDSRIIAKSAACRERLKTVAGFYEEDLETVLRSGSEWAGEGIEPGGLKLFIDGALGSRTALLLEPYGGDNRCGLEGLPPEGLKETALFAVENGIDLCLHAIGDRAVRIALDLLEEIPGETGKNPSRNRIEHIQLLHPDDLPRFKDTGAIASIQPAHIIGDRIAAERAWGERCRYAYPLKSLIENGVRVAFGSDMPAGPVDPLVAIRVAVTREIGEGKLEKDRWYSGEAISVEEAFASHTAEAAFAAGIDGSTGMIREGLRADLTVLSRDPFRSEEDLRETEVVATMVRGEVFYDKEGLFSPTD